MAGTFPCTQPCLAQILGELRQAGPDFYAEGELSIDVASTLRLLGSG